MSTANAQTSTTAAGSTTNSGSILSNIEATLSADWADFVAFIKQAEADAATFLSKVASGAQIAVADVEAIGQYVAGHLSSINGTITAVGTLANSIAPGNADVAKVLTDLNTGATDVAAMSQALSSGTTSGDPQVVTTAVNAVNAVQALSSLASQASATLAQITAQSPTATQAVSAQTPNEG